VSGLGYRTALYHKGTEAVMSVVIDDPEEAKRMLDFIEKKYPQYPCELLQVIERREKS